MKDLDLSTDIVFLADSYKGLDKTELLDSLGDMCTPLQTGIIMNHIDLLEGSLLIGYHKTEDRVFLLDEDGGLMEITKSKGK